MSETEDFIVPLRNGIALISVRKYACQTNLLDCIALFTCRDVKCTRHNLRHEVHHAAHHSSLALWQNIPWTLFSKSANAEIFQPPEVHMRNLK